ncbi:MAG: hypothetical protein KDD66_17770 [Bdellovibrionales bacterium]|nr:hypothetical protein [Bdellovibrionales bacterium]
MKYLLLLIGLGGAGLGFLILAEASSIMQQIAAFVCFLMMTTAFGACGIIEAQHQSTKKTLEKLDSMNSALRIQGGAPSHE